MDVSGFEAHRQRKKKKRKKKSLNRRPYMTWTVGMRTKLDIETTLGGNTANTNLTII